MNRPTGIELANEIGMLRVKWQGAVMLTEGDCDCRLYEKVLGEEAWRFIPGGGWESVVEALDNVSTRGIKGVVGIVDRDYRFPLGKVFERADLLCTDKHDLEMMMYETEAFDALIRECGSEAKVSTWPKGVSGIRAHLYEQSRQIGYVRLSNEANDSGYCFKNLNYESFVDRSTVTLALERFIEYLRARWGQNLSVTIATYENGRTVATRHSSLSEDGMLCRGHDVSEMVVIGLRSLWGTNPAHAYDADDIEKMLRLAYSREDFSKTELSRKILGWYKKFTDQGQYS